MSEEQESKVQPGPIQPLKMTEDSKVKFRCHKGVSCFNLCCKDIDIILTPYDILRLKTRLGLTSDEFINEYTTSFEMDQHRMPGVKMKHKEGSRECPFVTEEGCSVYADRPTVCRYYPLGHMGMRNADEYQADTIFFLVKEDHCKGHEEDQVLTVNEYRQDQGVDVYDAMNQDWIEIVLKKRSHGPTIGKPSDRSLRLFHMCSYDLDRFRRFVFSEGFQALMKLSPEMYEKLNENDEELLIFSLKYLKQVLYGEPFVELDEDGRDERLAAIAEREQKYAGLDSEVFFPPESRFDAPQE